MMYGSVEKLLAAHKELHDQGISTREYTNPYQRTVGFEVVKTGEKHQVNLTALFEIRGTPLGQKLATPEGRAELFTG